MARWIYKEFAGSFDDMSDLPKELRYKLENRADIYTSKIVSEQVSANKQSRKQLLEFPDGASIETVLLRYEHRRSVCVSTQVGCTIGCTFCATGKMGFERNLAAGEIVEQVLHFAKGLKESSGKTLTHVVFMGMGEPLLNYGNLWKAIRNLHEPDFFDLGARHITVSTAGVAPKIIKFAEEDLPVGLAISLHAPENELRSRLVPLNKKYPIETVIAACKKYIELTHRRVTFEYALLEGINDNIRQARELGLLLKGMLCHVNLIPVNPIEGTLSVPSSRSGRWDSNRNWISTTFRTRSDWAVVKISQAACGQLKTTTKAKRAKQKEI